MKRIFSQLKLIKNDCHANLSQNWLDQLVRINVDGPAMKKWNSSSALEIWYKEKCRRVTASTQASTSHVTESEEVKDDQSAPFSLGEWKEWVKSMSVNVSEVILHTKYHTQLLNNHYRYIVTTGAGLPPISSKLISKIEAWDFIDMSELLPDLKVPETHPKMSQYLDDVWLPQF